MQNNFIIFLQNSWSPFYSKISIWPRRSWLRALENSKSGKRLKILTDNLDLCEETTPVVGAISNSIVPPNPAHIKEILNRRDPEIVVACGKQAENALVELWDGPLLAIPHPAYRFLRDALYIEAKMYLESGCLEANNRRIRLEHPSKQPYLIHVVNLD